MSPAMVTLIMFGSAIFLVFAGLGIAFALGSSALIIGVLLFGAKTFPLVSAAIDSIMTNWVLVAALCFTFMAMLLETSGVAEDLFRAMHAWFGPLAGGLAVGTIIICTLLAAMSGIAATGTMTMGLIALPAMLKRGYSKTMALGPVAAGGALGVLIPPSVLMIVYGLIAEASIGQLFMGGVFAGLLLSILFIMYILVRSFLQPSLAPPAPPEERLPLIEKIKLTKGVILPILLIIAVLGVIFAGIATPTEASAVGAAGAAICMLINRKFTFRRFWRAGMESMRVVSAVLWLIMASKAFSVIYAALQGRTAVLDAMSPFVENPMLLIVMFQILFFILGCVLEPTAIVVIFAPIFVPLVEMAGFDPIWFGVLFVVNMQMGYLTPPFGYCLFYLKAVAPPGVTINDIYKSIIPYVAIQAVGLVACIMFPQIILWLPSLMLR